MEPVKIRSLEEIKEELKKLFVENLSLEDLKPEDIKDDMELFGETGIGLDSLDGVEIVVLLRRQYGLDVKAMQKGPGYLPLDQYAGPIRSGERH